MDRIIFAAEKLVALVVSQRFAVTMAAIIGLIVALGGIVVGVDATVDEADLAGQIAGVAGQVAVALTGVVAFMRFVVTLIESIEQRGKAKSEILDKLNAIAKRPKPKFNF